MGANGSYSKASGGIPLALQTHEALSTHIDGHKILIHKKSPTQAKLPLNSNSERPIYLIAKVDKKTGVVFVKHICIYRKHELVAAIDLEFDKNGNYKPYKKGDGSHIHRFFKDKNGDIERESHNSKNIFPVPKKYRKLINKIETYNKEKHHE